MKRKMTLLATSLLALAAVTTTMVTIRSGDNMSLIMRNVEALGQTENGGGCGFAAYQYDGDWYEDTKNFQRCGDCEWVSGTKPQYREC